MGTVITEADGGRKFLIEAGIEGLRDSVFMTEIGGLGVCYEFKIETVRSAIRRELGMVDSVDLGLERLLAV